MRSLIRFMGLAVCFVAIPAQVGAKTIVVDDAEDQFDADSGDNLCARIAGTPNTCTLRAALDVAVSGDLIEIDPTVTTIVLYPKFGALKISKNVTITAKALGRTKIDGTQAKAALSEPVIVVLSDPTIKIASQVVLENLEIANGDGGIYDPVIATGCSLQIKNCYIHDNILSNTNQYIAGNGGGISANCSVVLSDSVVANNKAIGSTAIPSGGGGIYLNGLYGALTVERSVITGNEAGGTQANGGGVLVGGGVAVAGGAPHSIRDSLIANNQAVGPRGGGGGGLAWSGGVLSHFFLANVTFAGNTSRCGNLSNLRCGGVGGAIYFDSPGPADINNVTIADNNATSPSSQPVGGGINIAGSMPVGAAPPVINVSNTIIARNKKSLDADDCTIATPPPVNYQSLGYNLVGESCPHGGPEDQVALDPNAIGLAVTLADNTGPTQTLALLQGSPAIDKGSPQSSNPPCEEQDQRLIIRPIDGDLVGGPRCDIGAFEYQPASDVQLGKTSSPTPVVGEPMTYTLTVTNTGPDFAPAVAIDDDLPSILTDASASPSQGSCTITGQLVHCVLGDLAVGATATVIITATPSTPGELTNNATVSHREIELNPSNDRAGNTTTVAPAPVKPQDVPVVANEVSQFSGSGLVRGRACNAAGGEGGLVGWTLMLIGRCLMRRRRTTA